MRRFKTNTNTHKRMGNSAGKSEEDAIDAEKDRRWWDRQSRYLDSDTLRIRQDHLEKGSGDCGGDEEACQKENDVAHELKTMLKLVDGAIIVARNKDCCSENYEVRVDLEYESNLEELERRAPTRQPRLWRPRQRGETLCPPKRVKSSGMRMNNEEHRDGHVNAVGDMEPACVQQKLDVNTRDNTAIYKQTTTTREHHHQRQRKKWETLLGAVKMMP